MKKMFIVILMLLGFIINKSEGQTGEEDRDPDEQDLDELFDDFQTQLIDRMSRGESTREIYLDLCKCSLLELELIKPALSMLSIEECAEYADYVTRASPTKAALQLQTMEEEMGRVTLLGVLVKDANTAGIGNLAYAALHAKDETLRIYAQSFFELWKSEKLPSHYVRPLFRAYSYLVRVFAQRFLR
jgi:hypothetical protein